MNWLRTIGLRTYYQIRRIKKALRNWRKFGVIMFGSIFLATIMTAPVGESAGQILTMVTIKPSATILEEGNTKQFRATAYDQYGETIVSDVDYEWRVMDSKAGSIGSSGLFTAGSTPGRYNDAIRLKASFELATKFTYATVTVSASSDPEPTIILTAVTVSPSATILEEGNAKKFSARSYDQYGNQITSGVTYSWTVTNSNAGTISGLGLFTASDVPGKYTNAVRVRAGLSSSIKYGYATVTVSAASDPEPTIVLTAVTVSPSAVILEENDTEQFSATSYDQHGNQITSDVAYSWTLINSNAGSINGSGLFTAGDTPGKYTNALRVRASLNSSVKYAYATVTVSASSDPDPEPTTVLTAVTVSPSATILEEGDTKQFSTKAYDQYGNQITSGITYSWTVTNSNAGIISGSGLFTASDTPGYYSGAVRVRASMDSSIKYAYASVTVSAGSQPEPTILTTVTIAPAAVILEEGATQQFSAQAYDQYNDPIASGVTYSWAVTNSNAGNISSSGLFTTGDTPGYYSSVVRVTAQHSSATRYGYASVTVSDSTPDIVLMSVTLSPTATILDQGAIQQFSATSYDQFGQVITSGVAYSWSVVNGGGSINQNGLFTAGYTEGTFLNTVQIQASRGGVDRYAYATVMVNEIIIQGVLDWVEILPPSITINTYQSYDFDAQAYDDNDNPLFSGISYTWSVISGSGSINQNGLFTASGSTGTTTVQVRAAQGAINVYDTATVAITSGGGDCTGILSYVIITPYSQYLDQGESDDFNAQAYDTDGCPMSATYTWDVMDDTAGSINQNGYFTASYTAGTYTNTVRVRAYRSGITRYDYADVIVGEEDGDYYINATISATDENGGILKISDVILYALRLHNNRDDTLTNVVSRMDLPDHTSFVSATSDSGTPLISYRTITWDTGNLLPGQVKTMRLRVQVDSDAAEGTWIKGRAYVTASELTGGFWVQSNELMVGESDPTPPLAPTGTSAWAWILAVVTALLATVLTRQILYTRKLLLHSRE